MQNTNITQAEQSTSRTEHNRTFSVTLRLRYELSGLLQYYSVLSTESFVLKEIEYSDNSWLMTFSSQYILFLMTLFLQHFFAY
jgi:hypothetical protein